MSIVEIAKSAYKKYSCWIGIAGAIMAAGSTVGLTMIAGCGAGSDNTNALAGNQTTSRKETGKASFSIEWPKPSVNGRLIPIASESVDLRLLSGDGKSLWGEQVLARPSGGGAATTTFNAIPVGSATLMATAYPNTGGSGVAQATAATSLTVVQNQTATVSLTMASTISKITITPSTPTPAVGQSEALTATATDASGNVVFITSSTLTWSSSASGIASVDVSGKVTATAVGTANIVATETESGISGTDTVTVSAASPSPSASSSPTPAPATSISFAAPVAYTAPLAGRVITADFDGDGNSDIAVASNGSILVFYGNGDGTFTSGQIIYTGAGDNPTPQVAADMNNDGKLDIVCGADSSSHVYILLNTGNRTFSRVLSIPVSGGTKIPELTVADFNGDGRKDVAAVAERSSSGGSGFVIVLLNDGTGSLTAGQNYSMGGYAEGITSGDINGDGKVDLIATYIRSSGGSQVLLGNGDGTFTSGSSYDTASQNVPTAILADFNKDGKIDLGVDDYFDNNMGVLFGNGDGTFQAVMKYSDSPYPLYWQAVDLNNDGYPDIITPNAGTGNFTVLQNKGNGLFSAGVQLSDGGSNTRYCATADFNHDGRPDLVFSCQDSNSVQVMINTSK